MLKHLKQSFVFLTIAALILIPFATESLAQDTSAQTGYTAEKMVADILLVRPVGILATVFGSAVFIVALPFSLLGGNTGATFENLVVTPAKFTFKRPLGDL
jgi:hypothetical protein